MKPKKKKEGSTDGKGKGVFATMNRLFLGSAHDLYTARILFVRVAVALVCLRRFQKGLGTKCSPALPSFFVFLLLLLHTRISLSRCNSELLDNDFPFIFRIHDFYLQRWNDYLAVRLLRVSSRAEHRREVRYRSHANVFSDFLFDQGNELIPLLKSYPLHDLRNYRVHWIERMCRDLFRKNG